jgi:hypothetical protein
LLSLLHRDPVLPTLGNPPDSFEAFQAIGKGLLELLCAVEGAEYATEDHRRIVLGLVVDLTEGNVISVKCSEGSGMAKEYLWMAFGRTARSPRVLEWLLAPNNPILLVSYRDPSYSETGQLTRQEFAPAPILHATPPAILDLRQRSASTFLTSLTHVVPSISTSMIQHIFSVAQDLIISDLARLPQNQGSAIALGHFHLACLTYSNSPNGLSDEDPSLLLSGPDHLYLDAIKGIYLVSSDSASGMETALEQLIRSTELGRLRYLLQSLSSDKELKPLSNSGIQAILKVSHFLRSRRATILIVQRIESSPGEPNARDLLLDLSKSHPQQYYKPLFSLAAASAPSTASTLFKSIRTISGIVGVTAYWLEADALMIAVVLMGDGKQGKSKDIGKEGGTDEMNLKIGRYAVLVEFLRALIEVKGAAKL